MELALLNICLKCLKSESTEQFNSEHEIAFITFVSTIKDDLTVHKTVFC